MVDDVTEFATAGMLSELLRADCQGLMSKRIDEFRNELWKWNEVFE